MLSIFATGCRSGDGIHLIVSSKDGYCSLITFDENELGETYPISKQESSGDKDTGCTSTLAAHQAKE